MNWNKELRLYVYLGLVPVQRVVKPTNEHIVNHWLQPGCIQIIWHMKAEGLKHLTSHLDQVNAFSYEVEACLIKICCNTKQEQKWKDNYFLG